MNFMRSLSRVIISVPATRPAVLLGTIPADGWMRIEPADAAEVLRALTLNAPITTRGNFRYL